VLAFVAVGAIVVFLVWLIRFTFGFSRRRVMAHKNIVALRRISLSLGVTGLSMYAWHVIDFFWLRAHVVIEGYRISLESPPSAMIVALILWAMTEILNLAGKLQNEQDLTI
jgi:hypothetical protein